MIKSQLVITYTAGDWLEFEEAIDKLFTHAADFEDFVEEFLNDRQDWKPTDEPFEFKMGDLIKEIQSYRDNLIYGVTPQAIIDICKNEITKFITADALEEAYRITHRDMRTRNIGE